MPASAYDPISSALKNSFHGGAKKTLDSRIESTLQKSMLMTVHFDDPVKQVPSLSPGQKSKYTVLNPNSAPSTSSTSTPSPGRGGAGKLDNVPEPKITLFRRDQVELGYRQPAGPGAGMFNMGNTCYLNSTLQALFHTPAFVNYLRHGGHESQCNMGGQFSCTICLLSATLRASAAANVIKPVKVYEKLKLICKHLTHGRQEDAHEFLRYLVESLQKCYLVSRKIPKTIDNYTKETTPFNQIFGGYMRQDVICQKCRHVSTTFQHFMDLLLDIRQADTIEAALQGYFRRESLGQGENMYKCEKCQQKVPATKQYRMERPPLVLCLQLKRFNLMGGKNGRPVTLARRINVSPHVRWAAQQALPVEYRLVSMINHVGPSPNCGHYTSIGEAANGTFYRFDDASVHPTSLQSALHTSAYVIFYELIPASRDLMLTPRAQEAARAPEPRARLIGPALPPPAGPSPRPLVAGPVLPPQQTKNRPGLITEPAAKPRAVVAPLVRPKPAAPATLVPYGSDSDSDEASPPVQAVTKPPVQAVTKPAVQSAAVAVSSPFLPRSVAANLKKQQGAAKEKEPVEEAEAGGGRRELYSPPKPAAAGPPPRASESRNEFTVTELDAHNPSVHSDNSTGSTTSFTVTDIAATSSSSQTRPPVPESSSCSRHQWTVSPVPASGAKRERPDPEEEQAAEVTASPKKRKKTATGLELLGARVAEVSKDVWAAGSRLFRPQQAVQAPTSCEATTSHQDGDRASSSSRAQVVASRPESEVLEADDEAEDRRKVKKHKKKKKKHKSDHKESDYSWEERGQEKERQSGCDPGVVARRWDDRPNSKTIARSNTWDGSKGTGLLEELRRGQEIQRWDGERSAGWSTPRHQQGRKRGAEEEERDREMDRGRTKKVRPWREDAPAYRGGHNPFQAAQEARDRAGGREERRSWGGQDRSSSHGSRDHQRPHSAHRDHWQGGHRPGGHPRDHRR